MKRKSVRKIVLVAAFSLVMTALLAMSALATSRDLMEYDQEAGLYIDNSYSKFCYILNEDGTATVTGNPEGVAPEDGSENTFAYGSTTSKAKIPTTVKYGGKTYTVTAVADDAFANHTSLKRVVFESDVKIGDRAFLGCSALANVDLEGVTYIGDGAFSYGALTTVEIPETVTHIGNNAFYYNPTLATISGLTKDNVTYIGSGAFQGTDWYKKLTDEFVVLGNGILIKYNGTSSTVVIPSGVVGIADAFSGKSTVIKVDFSQATSLEFIGNNAFYGCRILESVVVPDSVKDIGDFAFASCFALKDVTVGAGLESLGFCAFSGCDALESFSCTSEKLAHIGECVFWNCFALKEIDLASCPDVLAFGYLWGAGVKSYDIPDNIKTIDKGAFAGVNGLVMIVPKSVESIVADAFAGASATIICAPDSVAAQYAEKNFAGDTTKNVILFGDVNSDGAVDVADLSHFLKYFAGNSEATIGNNYAGDTVLDGKVSLKDMSNMMKYLAGAQNITMGK